MKHLVLRFLAVLFLLNLFWAIYSIVTLEWWLLIVNIILVFPLSGAIILTINKQEDVSN